MFVQLGSKVLRALLIPCPDVIQNQLLNPTYLTGPYFQKYDVIIRPAAGITYIAQVIVILVVVVQIFSILNSLFLYH